MMLLPWLLGGIIFGIVLGFLSGRFAIPMGLIVLALAAAPMGALYVYTEVAHPARDMSSEGMLSTIALLILGPVGVATLATGIFNVR